MSTYLYSRLGGCSPHLRSPLTFLAIKPYRKARCTRKGLMQLSLRRRPSPARMWSRSLKISVRVETALEMAHNLYRLHPCHIVLSRFLIRLLARSPALSRSPLPIPAGGFVFFVFLLI